MKKESKRKIRIFSWVVFTIYLVVMVYFLFFSEQMGRSPSTTYRYNLKPFAEIKRYLCYSERIGSFNVMLNLAGNVICFMPFGFVIPILSSRQRGFFRMLLLSFLSSLLVELLQLVSMLGSCDVDDIILNTLGGVIGYLTFVICNHIFHWKTRSNEKGQ